MKTIDQTTAHPLLHERPARLKPAVAPARRTMRVILALGALLCAGSAPTHAQTWETIDDAAGATGEGVYKVTSDSAGNIFAAGYVRDATERYHAVIMKSSDSGATWATVIDYPAVNDLSAPNGPFAGFTSIVSADVGGERHLVATGTHRRLPNPGYRSVWMTIRSRDGGATWETLDEYLPPFPSSMPPRDVAVDANGNHYIVALVKDQEAGNGNSHWLIRKGQVTSGGMTWSMVGDFSYADGWDYSYGHGFAADGPSRVVCVGSSVFVAGSGANSWIVRKSSNGGSTWQVVDTYQYGKNLKSHAFDVAADSAGNVYVAGYGQKLGTRWIVRRLASGGTKWSTVDDFRLSGGSYAEGKGIAIDSNNNVHVTGMAAFSQGKGNWVTRQRSAATGAWSTIDTFSLAAVQDTAGRSITADPSGNLFAAGSGTDAEGVSHGWLVRRKPAP